MLKKKALHFLTRVEKILTFDAHYFITGGFWLLIAQATTIIGSLVTTVLFAHYLSENDFGLYRYIIGLSIFFSGFALTGIGQSIIQTVASGTIDFFRFSTRPTLLYGLGASGISLVTGGYYFYNGNNFLAVGCLLIAIFQPVSILFLNTIAYLYGRNQYKQGTYFQGLKSVFVMLASILTLIFTHNIILLLSVYFMSQALAAVIGYHYYKPKTYARSNITPQIAKQYMRFAQHISIQNLIVGSAVRLDSIIVFQQLGAASLALFTIATLVPDQIRGAFKNILALLIPKYSKYNSLEELRQHIPKRSWQFAAILFLITVLFILIVPIIYNVIFPKYTSAIIYTQLLALSFPASVYLLPLSALQAQIQERSLYYFNITTSILQIITTIGLTFWLGLLGAILARIIIQYVMLFGSFYLVFRKI